VHGWPAGEPVTITGRSLVTSAEHA